MPFLISNVISKWKLLENNFSQSNLKSLGILVTLPPIIWKWKMGPWKMSLVSKGVIFHFHDCWKKSTHHLPQALGHQRHLNHQLFITFPQEYPVRPPRVEVLGSTVTHPNVFSTFICLDMLEGGEWASDEELLDCKMMCFFLRFH